MPAYPSLFTRLARYTVLVAVAFALLWLARWQGWLFRSDRQYVPRVPAADAIAVPDGYRVEVLAAGLNAPSSLEVTPDGTIYIGESGYGGAYASTTGYEGATPGRVLRLNRDGTRTVVAGEFKAPLSSFFHAKDGTLYVSHHGVVTAIKGAVRQDIVTGLPSLGDHKNNSIVMGPDNRIYLAQGTATNTGIVGLDNWTLWGWGRFFPSARDIPCRDVVLRGVNVKTADPRSIIPFMNVETGAFSPFGHKTYPGQVITGELPCNGAIMRFQPDGSELELVAWGLRNPFDVRFSRSGQLYAIDNGPDDRGSRPFSGDDLFEQIRPGAWYGWPDYWNGRPATELGERGVRPELLLEKRPGTPERALAELGEHVAGAGFDFAPGAFGFESQAFIARWGTGFPATSQDPALAGFDIARLDLQTRRLEPFARNKRPGPASLYEGPGGFERPVSVRFGPDGAMYVLDWGHMGVTRQGPYHIPGGGVLWRISKVR